MTPVRWGALSTARINRLAFAAARASRHARFTAVASRDGAKARRQADEHGIERALAGYEALLADPAIDAVYVSLPNALHVEWSMRALAAGKHVLCEKPLSRHPDDVAAAFALAERNGLVLAEAFMYRFHPQTTQVSALIAGGAIGEVAAIAGTLSFRMADAAHDIRSSAALEGGALMDVGCYCVSGARLFAGEPTHVHAEAIAGPTGVDVELAAVLRFGERAVATFDASTVLPRRDRLEIAGRAGSIVLEDPWHGRAPSFELRRGDGAVERIAVPAHDAYVEQLDAVSQAIRGERALPFGAADAVAQATALAGLQRSIETGERIALGGT
jgi:xylose dehydrogenase (NAD/NADP)